MSKSLPKYFSYGSRKLNVILTQLRCLASFLNYDLFRVNIISDPSCRCGAPIENTFHYFFECPLYRDERAILIQNLNWLPNGCNIDLNLLLSGTEQLSIDENEVVLNSVHSFIKGSKRFLIV